MPITKTEKEMLRSEFSKVWKDQKMTDYCTNKVAAYATLPDGKIVVVDKESIEKDFCFGESGYDYDDAQDMAAYARKSEEYFKKENMKHFDSWVKDLTEAMDLRNARYILTIIPRQYTRQAEDCRLVGLEWKRFVDVIDACGGSVRLEELPGKVVKFWNQERRIATKEEIELILEAYKEAAEAHEKKVNTYLKKYGMSKVHTWTYWRDA